MALTEPSPALLPAPTAEEIEGPNLAFEALKHEKYLYLARADVYPGSSNPLRLLAERIEGLISQEHARWISSRRHHDEEERAAKGKESED